jgi:hypothetical protein
MALESFPRRQQEFLFQLVDGNGVTVATFHVPNLKVEMNGYQKWLGGVRICTPAFDPPAGATFCTLTVVVNRPLSFDFLVNPADVRTEKH